jgi:phenylpropionate dioxygenase-like ring-hydroxylating dioxygenase large terminal subunit
MESAPDTDRPLAELIVAYRPGRSLPREFYTSPRVFEHDIQRVYLRHWLFVGHVARIPQTGDYFLFPLAGESVIVVRAKDGSIHAILNVCPHRGSRICLEPEGRVAKLVCPYHAWSFNLDGSFLTARQLPEAAEHEDLGLRQAHVQVVEGLIHICLAQQPPDLEPLAADIRKFYGPHGLPQAKIAVRTTLVLRANWKIAAENFFECYHCLPSHPELDKVMSYVRAFDSSRHAEERREYTVRWEARARELGHVTGANKRTDGACHSVCRIPIREGFLTQSKDGRPVAPLMGSFKAYDGGVTGMQFYPINWFVADNDYAMLVRFTPLALQETEAEITWLVHREAVEGRDYQVEALTWLWANTLREDQKITEDNQAGVNSRFYRPGPHSKEEQPLDEFLQWYLRQIS